MNAMRKLLPIFFAVIMVAATPLGWNAAASSQNMEFDCSSIAGLEVLDATLKSQPDGGWALFDSLSVDCQGAYVAAQSVARVEIVAGEPKSVETPDSDMAVAASGCTPAWVSAYAYTYLGNVAYRYVFQDYFCFNGSTVTSHSPSHWIDNVDPNYYWRGGSVISQQWIGTGYWTEMQGRVENCVFKYGCVGNAYPGGWIQTYGSGYWTGNAWSS